MRPTGPQILALAASPAAWAVHFIAVYALISAACAPRALIGTGDLRVAGAAVTLAALVVAVLPLAMRVGEASLLTALRWLAAIAVAAILADAAFLAFFPTCGG